jgi:hypothetical protein
MTDYPHFEIDFLGCTVRLILDSEWLKIASKILNDDLSQDENICSSNAIAFAKDNTYYIAAPKSVKNSTIYHECFHILMEITDDFDLGIKHNDHELQAYLIEYLIEQTLKLKNQKVRTSKAGKSRGKK